MKINHYLVSKILFIVLSFTTALLMYYLRDPMKLRYMGATDDIMIFLVTINFILLAISSIYFIWQKAKRNNTQRQKLETFEAFAATESNRDSRITIELAVPEEKFTLLQSPNQTILIPKPADAQAINVGDIIRIVSPSLDHNRTAPARVVSADGDVLEVVRV